MPKAPQPKPQPERRRPDNEESPAQPRQQKPAKPFRVSDLDEEGFKQLYDGLM